MKRMILGICSVSLVVIIALFVFSIFGSAEIECEKSGIRLTYIDNYRGSISKGLLSTSVYAEVTGKTGVTKVKIKMELQKLSDGSYSTIETWEQTFNSIEGSMNESKATNPFSTYRLKATVTAYSGSNSESQTFYKYE